MTEAYHIPVLAEESSTMLVGDPAGTYVDCTLGGGGHSALLLERYPRLRVIGIDCDAQAVTEAGARLAVYGDRMRIVRDNFRNIRAVVASCGLQSVSGVLADLGVSSRQFDDRARGFSFESPVLDMRMDDRARASALELVNTADEKALADILYLYGEERRSRQIARRIVERRQRQPIATGAELAGIVAGVRHRTGRTHPATAVFQALRIAVNDELESLRLLLADIPDVIAPGGRAVIISYHSLEDRLVKHAFRALCSRETAPATPLTKKPMTASPDETARNPRARSAKLRAVQL